MQSLQTEKNKACLNCQAKVDGNFCSVCGQTIELPRINFSVIIADFFGSVFNLNAPFPSTIWALFKKPGSFVKDFISGKRKWVYPPVRFLVVSLFINLLIGELIGYDPIDNQIAIDEINGVQGNKEGYEAGRMTAKYLNFFLFLFPFSMAIVSRLFFWKSSYNLAERTVLGFYLSGQYILIAIIPVVLTVFDPRAIYSLYMMELIYLTYAFYHFFLQQSKLKTFLKSLAVSILAIVLYFAVAMICGYLLLYLRKLI